MSIELTPVDDASCLLIERATGTTITNQITIPTSKSDLLEGMNTFLGDAEATSHTHGDFQFVKMRDKLRITSGVLVVELKYNDVFALIIAGA